MKRILLDAILCFALAYSMAQTSVWAQEKNAAAASDSSQKERDRFDLPETDDELEGSGPFRRADWFRNVWRGRRTSFEQHKEKQKSALVFLGDSITQGWGDDFRGAFGVRVANRGISGDTTRGMLHRLQEDVLDLEPRGVVLLMGTNDIEEGAEPETIAQNIDLIANRITKANAKTPVVVCLVFPSSESKKRPSSTIRALNDRLVDMFRGRDSFVVIDTWSLFADPNGDAKESEFPDLLHLNDAGYKKWENAIRPVLESLELIPAPEHPFANEPGFVSLFNGTDLTGWGFRVTSEADRKASEGWRKSDPKAAAWPIIDKPVEFSGKRSSDDGRYVASNKRIVVMTPTEGRRIQQLWTTREFPNDFILRLEFRATPNADSGIFIRGNQLQCRDFPLAGPYKDLKQYRAGDWNEIEVIVNGTVARCTCNGELLEEAMVVPATGPIGLEGDRGQMEYRNIRIREATKILP